MGIVVSSLELVHMAELFLPRAKQQQRSPDITEACYATGVLFPKGCLPRRKKSASLPCKNEGNPGFLEENCERKPPKLNFRCALPSSWSSPISAVDTMTENEQSKAPDGDEANNPNRPGLVRSDELSEATKDHLLFSAYEILRSCTFDEVDFDKVVEAIKEDEKVEADRVYWVDALVRADAIEAAVPIWHEKVLDSFDISIFMRNHLLQAKQLQRPQVLSSDKGTLIVMRVLTPATSNTKDVRFSAALCMKRVLLSFTSATKAESKGPRKQDLLKNTISCMFERKLDEPTVSGAAAMWLSTHLARTADAAFKLRAQILKLSDEDIEDVDLDTLIDLKDSLLRVSAVAEEQSECVQAIANAKAVREGLSFARLKVTLDVMISTTGSTERMLARLETRLDHLRNGYDANKQERINHRLNVLTIFNAVFLPLTLMAGIWGMNFENMPGLERENAYFYALGAMAFVALVMLFIFYWRGWLTM